MGHEQAQGHGLAETIATAGPARGLRDSLWCRLLLRGACAGACARAGRESARASETKAIPGACTQQKDGPSLSKNNLPSAEPACGAQSPPINTTPSFPGLQRPWPFRQRRHPLLPPRSPHFAPFPRPFFPLPFALGRAPPAAPVRSARTCATLTLNASPLSSFTE